MAHQIIPVPVGAWIKIADAGQLVKTLETKSRAIYYVESAAAPVIERIEGFQIIANEKIIQLTVDADLYVQSFYPDSVIRADIQ